MTTIAPIRTTPTPQTPPADPPHQIKRLEEQVKAQQDALKLIEAMMRRGPDSGSCGGGNSGNSGGGCGGGGAAPASGSSCQGSAPVMRLPGEEGLTDAQVAQKRAAEQQRMQQQAQAMQGCCGGMGCPCGMCGGQAAQAGFATQRM